MKPQSHRLERWLLAGALTPLLVALVAQSVWAALVERQLVRHAMDERLQTMSRLGVTLAAGSMHSKDPRQLSEALKSLEATPDFRYAALLDAEGHVLAYLGDPRLREERLAQAHAPYVPFEESEGLGLNSPVERGGRTLGQLVVVLNTDRPRGEVREHLLSGGLLSMLALVVTVAVVVFLVRSVRARDTLIERDRELLAKTGTLARVGGWELLLPQGEFRLTAEAERVLGGPTNPGDLMRFIGLEQRALVKCVDNGTPFEIEVRLDLPDDTRWVRVQGQAETTGGQTTRVFGAIQNVTEQRNAREQAMAASRSKSQFLANTSHEMRTPLNGILGMTTLALETSLTSEQRGYLEAVQLSGRNMLATVNDLLDVSRIESGKVSLEAVPIQLDELLVDAVRTLSTQAQAKDVQLVVTIPQDLELRRLGDPLRLSQIINNLVANAVKFTPQGEIDVRVSVGKRPDEVLLSVKDTGIGIPLERQSAIFDAFTQSDGSTSRKFGGSGLGLTITRELAHLMGGDVSVVSAPGTGSTFTAQLQLPVMPHLRAVPTLDARRALVIDPSTAARRAAQHSLERLGLEVVTVASLDSAQPLLGSVDAVLVDVTLMTETTRLRSPIVLVPFGYAGVVASGLRTVSKPLLPRELLAALSTKPEVVSIAAAPSAAAPSRVLEVLLAEDNAVNAALARRLIEKAGHRVVHVWNGREALVALERRSFDLVLMDVQMPELDGLETTRQLRRRESTTGQHQRVMAMTANAMKSDEIECRAAGMDGFIAKPVDVKSLRSLLESEAQRPAPSDASSA